jgi:hypothetical protein
MRDYSFDMKFGIHFSSQLPSPSCSCSCKKYEASGPSEGSQRTMKSSHPTLDLDPLRPPDEYTFRSYISNNLISLAKHTLSLDRRKDEVTCDLTVKMT